MATMTINSYIITEITPYGVAIDIGLGNPQPSKRVEIKSVADAQRELAAFAEELKASGKPLQVSGFIRPRDGRKPNGFSSWSESGANRVRINIDRVAAAA